MVMHQWECSNDTDTFKHAWTARVGLVCAMCPFCGARNTALDAKTEWEKSALFQWAKRKTNNDT